MTPEPGVNHLVTNSSETHHPTPEGTNDHNNEEADHATETQPEEGQRTPTPPSNDPTDKECHLEGLLHINIDNPRQRQCA